MKIRFLRDNKCGLLETRTLLCLAGLTHIIKQVCVCSSIALWKAGGSDTLMISDTNQSRHAEDAVLCCVTLCCAVLCCAVCVGGN